MGRAIIVSQIYCVTNFLNKTKRKKNNKKKPNQKLQKQKEGKTKN
jgi:hypothetical protein